MPRVILSLHSQMVKSGQTFKSWSNSQLWSKTGQRRGIYLQILIFLDVFAKLDYMIEMGYLEN